MLDSGGYELHHFREEVVDGQLVFDYQLHTGPLTTRNAIRILELYDYPPELIAEAYAVQERLLKTGMTANRQERRPRRVGAPASFSVSGASG
ncbi:MAG: hypothetical protein ACLR93_04735 [Alistipes onderdonkii]